MRFRTPPPTARRGARSRASACPRSTAASSSRTMPRRGASSWPSPARASWSPSATWIPGNWATDLAGGARFGYALLWVIMMSNLMAILLQHLCIKLGVVTGRDLAQACRDHYPRPIAWFLWVLAELAIAATDLAEVVGSAIGLQLLFGIPLHLGLPDHLDRRAGRPLPAEPRLPLPRGASSSRWSRPSASASSPSCCSRSPTWPACIGGFVPSSGVFRDQAQLYVAIGIIGATVMPHNLYLHSSIVQTRKYRAHRPRPGARRCATPPSTRPFALMCALFINAAILIVAAATFHARGMGEVAEIQEAYRLLSPVLGVGVASTLFAIALLASGPELHPDRHAVRPDRDGRLHQLPHAAVGAAAAHAARSRSSRR